MKTKHSLYIVLGAALTFTGCGNKEKHFNPDLKMPVAATTAQPGTEADSTQYSLSNADITLSILTPRTMSPNNAELLQQRLARVVTQSGFAAVGGVPQIALVPVLTELSSGVTTTAPVRHEVKYAAHFYIGNAVTGEVFAVTERTLLGVGRTKEQAERQAITAISADDMQLQKLVAAGKDKAVAYYAAHGETLLQDAANYTRTKNYAEALAILNSIPRTQKALYAKASAQRTEVFRAYMASRADTLVAELRAELGNEATAPGGYSERAMAIYRNIPQHTPAAAEANRLYAAYLKRLDPQARQKLAEWNDKVKRMDQKHELDMYQVEMNTKASIEGNAALLEKYKSDVRYERMGPLGRILNFGKE